ncbi:MAG: hypothetical protein AMXMBFR13_42630 [Phycisphaerae bacterium]
MAIHLQAALTAAGGTVVVDAKAGAARADVPHEDVEHVRMREARVHAVLELPTAVKVREIFRLVRVLLRVDEAG